MAGREEYHHPPQLIIGDPLKDGDQLLALAIELVARVDPCDELGKAQGGRVALTTRAAAALGLSLRLKP